MFRLRIKPGTSPSPDKNYERQDCGRQGDRRQDDVKQGMKDKLAGDKVMGDKMMGGKMVPDKNCNQDGAIHGAGKGNDWNQRIEKIWWEIR